MKGKLPAKSPGGPMVVAFFALLIMWLVLPIFLTGRLAQDAIPYIVAGQLVREDPHAVYASEGGDLFTLTPEFSRRFCELAPADTDCQNVNVAFVSTPLSLPLAWLLARFGGSAVLIMRFLAAAALAGGMFAIWKRLVPRSPEAVPALTSSALLLMPFVMVPLDLGQTSPVLFLSGALGVSASSRSQRFAAGASLIWVLAVVFKAWPAALVIILLWQRRWRFMAWSAGWTALLGVLSLPFSPVATVGGFLRTLSELNVTAGVNPYNGSVDAMVHNLWAPLSEGKGALVLLAVRVAFVAWAWWWGGRRGSADTQWAFAYVTLLIFVPLVWWHYLWVAVAAVAMALAARRRLGWEIWALPAVAAIAFPISIPNGSGHSWPVAQGLFLVGSVVLVAWLARDEPLPGRLEGFLSLGRTADPPN